MVRIAAVFPRSKLPLLLAFPIAVKAARVAVNIMFSVDWARRLLHAGSSSQFVIFSELPRSFFKAAFFSWNSLIMSACRSVLTAGIIVYD